MLFRQTDRAREDRINNTHEHLPGLYNNNPTLHCLFVPGPIIPLSLGPSAIIIFSEVKVKVMVMAKAIFVARK
jgi:hypothetical protein